MKRLLFFLLLVPLVAAACGGDPSPPTGDLVATPIPTAPAAAPTPVSISDATIDAIVLRASTLVYRGLEETMRTA